MISNTGTLYLIPIPIVEGAIHTLPQEVIDNTGHIIYYFVEDLRTARRFLRSVHKDLIIDNISFSEIDKHIGPDIDLFKKWLKAGYNIGILSEAGCPGIADPGAELVAIAQKFGTKVVPLTGPNSIILALMASGLNGQSFCFNGYLPVKDPARSQRIKAQENLSLKEKQTQIFIETPYRNDTLLADFLKHCGSNTKLCIAKNITAPDAFIKTQAIADWKKNIPVLGKEPTVFLILA